MGEDGQGQQGGSKHRLEKQGQSPQTMGRLRRNKKETKKGRKNQKIKFYHLEPRSKRSRYAFMYTKYCHGLQMKQKDSSRL